ncbi:MAG TPA: nitroreductase family protein, partial [archaeon]|nr:nitroreductase family protein [archaeon]
MSALQKPAETAAPIHDLLRHRWSPRAFDSRPVEPEKLRALFEAARWAASSYNAQPWFYIVATKDDTENYKRVLDSFVEFNQGWAKNAPVVALSVARMKFEHNGEPNNHAFHD